MSENIYTKLGFKKSVDFIYAAKIIDEAKAIFDKIPLKKISIRPLIIEQAVFEETLAISTAEDSDLTAKEAHSIQVSEEQEARIIKYKENKKLDDLEKYDQLEFENISAVENQISGISFKEINIDLISRLHHDLTVGMDDYTKAKGVSKYHPGDLRGSNTVKVGKMRRYDPPHHKDIRRLLNLLFKEFSRKRSIDIYDILEFHILLYAIHPFQNGNKRVARILESMLLDHYGYSADRTISLAVYYMEERNATNFFLMESLLRKDVSPFVNFAIRGYFYAGKRLVHQLLDSYLENFRRGFDHFIEHNVKPAYVADFKIVSRTIVELGGVFTYTEFVERMKKHRRTIGVSQRLIQELVKDKILRKKGRLYYFEKCLEINEVMEELSGFMLRNGVG